MVYDGIIIAIIVGLIRKGSLRELATIKFKWGWVFPFLLIIEIGVFYFENQIKFIGNISNLLFIIIYCIGLFFIWVNRDKYGFSFIFIGVFLNFLVMVINGGRMPVSTTAAQILDPGYIEALKAGLYAKHTLLTPSTHLSFLGDIIPLTKPYPKQQVISIGDVIMDLGMFLFIQKLMVKNISTKEVSESGPIKGGDINV